MSQFRHTRIVALLAGIVALSAAIAGCDSTESSQSGSSSTPSTSSTTSTTPSAAALDTPEAGKKLCDMMRPALSEWRVQTPTPDKVAFNIMVQQWAFSAGGLGGNATALRDKSVVDRVTSRECPDVRQQAIEAIDVASLADALLGS
jgi:hypothetical protein